MGVELIHVAQRNVGRGFHPLEHLYVVVQTGRVALPREVLAEQAVHVVEAQAQHRAALVAARLDRQAVRMAHAHVFEYQVHPVYVRIEVRILPVEHRVVLDVFAGVVLIPASRGQVVVAQFVDRRHVVAGVHVLGFLGLEIESERIIIGDARARLAGPLGGDQDDARRSLRTVDRSRCGVFQDGDVLDVVGIYVVDRAGHAVDQHVGVGRAVGHRGDAADADRGRAARRRVGAGDRHARHGALKGLRDGRGLTVEDRFASDRGERPRQVLFPHGAVAHDDHFVHRGALLLEHDVERRAAADGQGLGLVAQVGDEERCIRGGLFGQPQGEVALSVGRYALLGSRENDGSAGNRLPFLGLYASLNGEVLGRSVRWRK